MNKFLIVYFLCAIFWNTLDGAPDRIPRNKFRMGGGQDANIANFPYQVSINDRGIGLICAGVLISSQWVLTTASCVDSVQNIETNVEGDISVHSNSAVQGSSDIVQTKIAKYITHPNYDIWSHDNDIALIQLSSALQCTNCKPISFAQGAPNTGDTITTAGWGWSKTSDGLNYFPDTLQSVTVPVIDRNQCQSLYSVVPDKEITANMFCTADTGDMTKGFCTLDEGGAAVVGGNLVGLMVDAFGCNEFPRIYTVVSNYRDWISQNTGI